MYKFVAILAIIAIAQAARIPRDTKIVGILKSDFDVSPDGTYTYMFEAEDGSFREEKGVPMNIGKEDAYIAVTGTYKYIDIEGHPVEVHYTADQNGFVPSGTNIHEDIVKAARAAHDNAKA